MPDNPFDQASRYLAALDPPAFLGWLLRLSPGAFAFRGWLDTRGIPFPGDPDRASDTVAHVADLDAGGTPWVVAIEFQTKPDPEMFGRLMGYLSGLWLGRKPDGGRGSRFRLGAAVVNLTGSGSASRDMAWPAAGLHTQLAVVERNMATEPAPDLLGEVEVEQRRALLPWIPLMAGGDNPDLIDRWKGLAGAEPDRVRRGQYGVIALLFARRVGRGAIWEQKLEGWNVEESTYVNEWIAKGEARGEARGEIRQSQQLILKLGTKPFGAAPAEVEAAVRAIQDRPRLERIAERIFGATGWDDLLATA